MKYQDLSITIEKAFKCFYTAQRDVCTFKFTFKHDIYDYSSMNVMKN